METRDEAIVSLSTNYGAFFTEPLALLGNEKRICDSVMIHVVWQVANT